MVFSTDSSPMSAGSSGQHSIRYASGSSSSSGSRPYEIMPAMRACNTSYCPQSRFASDPSSVTINFCRRGWGRKLKHGVDGHNRTRKRAIAAQTTLFQGSCEGLR